MTAIAAESLQDWDLTQIINGKEIASLCPNIKHHTVVTELYQHITDYTKKYKLGHVFVLPLDVIFEEGVNRVQPDLIYISDENKGIIKDWVRGVPDLLVEIVSKSSFYIDTVDKKEIYQKYGVKEYWIVFPEYDTIEVFSLENDAYKIFSKGTDNEIVKSKLLEGLEVKVSDITA